MKKQNSESGSIMVEAAIIFPMALLAVMAMLYLGLFKLQETAMLYQVQRVASEGSLLASSPGYARLQNTTRHIIVILQYYTGKFSDVPGSTAGRWRALEKRF